MRGKPDRAEAKRESSSTQFTPKAACEPNAADNACKAADPIWETLEILDRIELAKIAGFDPTYIEGWGQGSSTFGKVADRPQAAREARSVHPARWETRDVPVSLHRDETGATAVNPLGELH